MELEKIGEDISLEQLYSLLSKLRTAGLQIYKIDSIPVYHIESTPSATDPMPSFLGYIQKDKNKESYYANLACTDEENLKPEHDKIRKIFSAI